MRLWDAWVCVAILFPLLAGGIWLRRPGLFLEWADLAVPTALTAVLAVILRARRVRVEDSPLSRWLGARWRRWIAALEVRPARALAYGTLAIGTLWAWVSIRRHWALASAGADLGLFENALWSLVNGNGYVSSFKDGLNLFADHQSPTYWLLAPLYALVPRAETLLGAQALGLASGAVAVFLLARQSGAPSWLQGALPLLYWGYRPIRDANAFDFHPEVFQLPLFLFGIWGLQGRRARALGAVLFALAIGCKESAAAVAAGVGLAWALGAGPRETRGFTRRLGWVVILAGAAAFAFDLRVVPGLVGGYYRHSAAYSGLGDSAYQVALSPFLRPGEFFGRLFGVSRIRFLLFTLLPLAGLPLFAPRALVAALPGYLMLFLDEGDRRLNPHFYYAIEPAVGLFWAASRAKLDSPRARWIALLLALAFHGRSEAFRIRDYSPSPHADWLRHELIPRIAAHSVAAPQAISAHLARRPWAHYLPNTSKADCVVLDPTINNWPVAGVFPTPAGYREEYRCGAVGVYSKLGDCLSDQPACPSRK